MNINKLIKDYLDNHDLDSLNIENIFNRDCCEINDENGWRIVNEIYVDEDGDLMGWTVDKDGELKEEQVYLTVEQTEKIINWLTNNG